MGAWVYFAFWPAISFSVRCREALQHETPRVQQVVFLNGEQFPVTTTGNTVVADVKRQLQTVLGVPMQFQRLLVDSQELRDRDCVPAVDCMTLVLMSPT